MQIDLNLKKEMFSLLVIRELQTKTTLTYPSTVSFKKSKGLKAYSLGQNVGKQTLSDTVGLSTLSKMNVCTLSVESTILLSEIYLKHTLAKMWKKMYVGDWWSWHHLQPKMLTCIFTLWNGVPTLQRTVNDLCIPVWMILW